MTYDKLVLVSEQPWTFTAKSAGSISAGDLVMFGSGAGPAGSTISTYSADDVAVVPASGAAATAHETVVGIAVQAAASGTYVAVLTDGIVALPAGSNGVSGGAPVSFVGYSNHIERTPTGSLAVMATGIGRSLSDATLDQFAWVRLRV